MPALSLSSSLVFLNRAIQWNPTETWGKSIFWHCVQRIFAFICQQIFIAHKTYIYFFSVSMLGPSLTSRPNQGGDIFYKWTFLKSENVKSGENTKCPSWTFLALSKQTPGVVLLSRVTSIPRMLTDCETSEELYRKEIIMRNCAKHNRPFNFSCRLTRLGSYHQTAIQRFCLPGCRQCENCCEWVSGPAKEYLVDCQLQWLRLPKKRTARPALLIRPPHSASNSQAWQKGTIQLLI